MKRSTIRGTDLAKANERQSDLELLRIFCMLAIVSGHFLMQSGLPVSDSLKAIILFTPFSMNARMACDVYVMIGAWFLVDKKFDIKRVIRIWIMTFFYSVSLTLITVYGLGRTENVTSGDILNAFFPISCYPLWFAGFYMVLLLATPILNMILDKFDRKQLKKGLIIFGFLSVFFVTFTNRPGFFSHDIWAMMYVYLLTGYIKRYVDIKGKQKMGLIIFLLCEAVIFAIRVIASDMFFLKGMGDTRIYAAVGHFAEFWSADLFSAFLIAGSAGIFVVFYNINIGSIKAINYIAGLLPGIYCFHQVPVFYPVLWEFVMSFYKAQTLGGRFLFYLASLLSVFLVGMVIELIRSSIMKPFPGAVASLVNKRLL